MMTMRLVPTLMCKQKLPLLHIPSGGIDLQILQRRPEKGKVVVVLGATGAGKSRLSIDLATRFPAEVVNSDKMQVYQGMDIVTNKITEEERCDVPHHLLGVIEPTKNFTAANFCSMASRTIKSIAGRGHLPIIAGGSNSFIEALVDGGGGGDCRFSSMYDVMFLWVDVAMPVLHAFVSERVDRMVEQGMIEEAREMFNPRNADYSRGLRKAIGVGEFHRYFRAESTADADTRARLLGEAIDAVKINTCQLARRQLEKIKRLRNVKGWKLHRVDATEVFRRRRCSGGGEDAEELWENLVAEPSATIVTRFLHNFGPLIYADVTPIRPAVMGRAMAAATH
ncbi:PREDICTED: adenylate isopentenyltransferase 3, chloroplastic-like [Ipomoea nil]|uniref:adenylate isopentenyltransferase 3, chloroplastic-like n=1 Tax=Ipomoea nil TaxID=35883 RepID=UPI0009015CD3|nr:PREDICTED: adenylate isopentenyltransferase 3, chloroplastic-like [Ipomoea nil]